MNKKDFIRIDNNNVYGSSYKRQASVLNENAPAGDFLARLWYLYGEIDNKGEESFSYVFKDLKTGIVFSAYSVGLSHSYGGFDKDEKILPQVLDRFDKNLLKAKYSDCEIKVDTDYGIFKIGSKNNIPFQIEVVEK